MNRKWETISTTTHFQNDHLMVATEQVISPARLQACSWTTVHRKPAVVIAAMTAERKFVLIHQERIPIRETIWEMPAGQVDELGDTGSFKDVALRELREETGYDLASNGEILFLGDFFASPGFTDERAFLFLARPVLKTASGQSHGDGESIIECREFSADEVTRLIADNIIRDANTLSTWSRLIARKLVSIT